MQKIIDEFAKNVDRRTGLFDVQIESEMDDTLILSGRLLDKSQLDELQHLFPDRKLDTTSIRILNAETHPRVHVTTNITGLYERPTFGMPLLSELNYGAELEVLDENGNWAFTRQSDGYLGWVNRTYLSAGIAPLPTHIVISPAIELRDGSDGGSGVITRLVSGTGVSLAKKRGRWSFVHANRAGWIPSSSLRSLADIPESFAEKQNLMLKDAERMIGVPYLWGGTSGNGIDCSGFVRLLHRWVGIDILRDADMQHIAALPVQPPFETGDLFFFGEGSGDRNITHVGMSLGGWTMIHASRRRNGVYVDDVQNSPFLKDIYVSGGSFLRGE